MPSDRPVLLLSIKPHYARLVIEGTKTVELRRIRPRLADDALVLIYASTPVRALVASARVTGVHDDDPESIWRRFGGRSGLGRSEFDDYLRGASRAVALEIGHVQRLSRARPLEELRKTVFGFRPPQSFRYLSLAQAGAYL